MRIEKPPGELPEIAVPNESPSEGSSVEGGAASPTNVTDQLERATVGFFDGLLEADSASQSPEVVKLPSDASYSIKDHTLTMTGPVDNQTTEWAKAFREGRTIDTLELQIPKKGADGQIEGYQTIRMKNVVVSSLQTGGSPPVQTVSFDFQSIEFVKDGNQ